MIVGRELPFFNLSSALFYLAQRGTARDAVSELQKRWIESWFQYTHGTIPVRPSNLPGKRWRYHALCARARGPRLASV
jgi:hypothetical protein